MKKKVLLGGVFAIALAMSAFSFAQLSGATKSSASIVKNGGQAVAETTGIYGTIIAIILIFALV